MQVQTQEQDILEGQDLRFMFRVMKFRSRDMTVFLQSLSKPAHFLTVDFQETNKVSLHQLDGLGDGSSFKWRIWACDDSMDVVLLEKVDLPMALYFDAHHSGEVRIAGAGYWSRFRIVEVPEGHRYVTEVNSLSNDRSDLIATVGTLL